MSFKIALLVCFLLMFLMAIATYYLAKKVSFQMMKYIPLISLGSGLIFFFTRLNIVSYNTNSIDSLFDKLVLSLILIVFCFAFLEAVIIEIVDNTILLRKSLRSIRKVLKLMNPKKLLNLKKEQVRWK